MSMSKHECVHFPCECGVRELSYEVCGEMTIRTRSKLTPARTIDIVGTFLEEYNGPSMTGPIFLSIISLLGSTLDQQPEERFGEFLYRSCLNIRSNFLVTEKPFYDYPMEIIYNKTNGLGTDWFVKMSPTTRMCTPYLAALEEHLAKGSKELYKYLLIKFKLDEKIKTSCHGPIFISLICMWDPTTKV